MPYFHLRLSISYLFCSSGENAGLWPHFGYLAASIHFPPNIVHLPYHVSISKSSHSPYASAGFFLRHNQLRALQFLHDERGMSKISECYPLKFGFDSTETWNSNVEDQPIATSEPPTGASDHKIKQRRKRKRQHGNKGKVPWNKGIRHSPETRAKIKQRTIEALRDPEIRKKMKEHAFAHSEENRAKISCSMRRLWDERLKLKRLKEEFFMSWAESIAKAAKEGGSRQQELHWDSFEMIRQDLILQQHQYSIEKAKAKEKRQIKAQIAVREKGKNKVEKREEQEEKVKERKERKSKKILDSSLARNLMLKQTLTKIRKRKSVDGQALSREGMLIIHTPAWQKLDIDLVKRDKLEREISLADQIQAARNRRATESTGKEALPTP